MDAFHSMRACSNLLFFLVLVLFFFSFFSFLLFAPRAEVHLLSIATIYVIVDVQVCDLLCWQWWWQWWWWVQSVMLVGAGSAP